MHAFELVARTLAALLMAAGFLVVSYLAGLRFCARRSVLSRGVTTIAALLVIPTALFHALAAPKLFALAPAMVESSARFR